MEEVQFKRVQLSDRDLIQSYLLKYSGRSCERTFANIFLWSRHYPVTYAFIENTLVFRSEGETEAFTYPAGEPENVKKALVFLRGYMDAKQKPFLLYLVTEGQFKQLEEWYPGVFEISYDRNDADYIYESEKLVTLSGKKLHAKRNHINKFKANHDNWNYETLSEDNMEECFQMALRWRNDNGCEEDEEKNAEMCVTLNALRLFRELELVGGLLKVDGEVVAFTIGEPVSEDTFVIHIEKAYADVQGAYPMINQQFAEHECANYKYINREEDTGSEGLRKAKLSYQPEFLVEKGLVKEKEQ